MCDHPLSVPVCAATLYMGSLCPWSLPRGVLGNRGQALGLDTSCWLRTGWGHPLCPPHRRDDSFSHLVEMTRTQASA